MAGMPFATPAASSRIAFAFFGSEPPDGVAEGSSITSSAGKLPDMAPMRVSVASATRAPLRFSASASNSAGNKCPPVPPAEIRMSGVIRAAHPASGPSSPRADGAVSAQ